LQFVLAAATSRCFARDPAKPPTDDQGGAAAAVIRIDIDGLHRAVFGAGPAFHAAVRVMYLGLFVLQVSGQTTMRIPAKSTKPTSPSNTVSMSTTAFH